MATSLRSKRRRLLDRWTAWLLLHLPILTRPEAKGLALWSLGIVLARSSSLHAVVLALACWLPFNPLSLRRRLQEWYYEAAAKKGHGSGAQGYQRRAWDPQAVCPYLFTALLDQWPTQQVVLALDPTNFGDRFTVLHISVLYRGCAIPVIWTVVEGEQPEAWEPHWERMLEALAGQLPAGWQVLVVTDRGMYSPGLFRCRHRLHWHPFLRIRAQGYYRPEGSQKWLNLQDLHPEPGQTMAFPAEVFKNEEGRLHGTLVAFQGQGHAEPWLLVTDLAAAVAQASWYGLRGWIEQGYKRVKSDGWNLPRTRIRSCERLERLWLAVAVATLWVLGVGGAKEVEDPSASGAEPEGAANEAATPALPDLGAWSDPDKEQEAAATPEPGGRRWSVFGRGWEVLRNALAVGVLLLGSWYPEPWPHHPVQGLPATPAVGATTAASQAGPERAAPDGRDVIHEEDTS